MADIGSQVFLQKDKQPRPQIPVAIKVLKAGQKGRHVITARATKINAGNVNGAAFTVGLDGMYQGSKPTKIDGYWVKKGPDTCQSQ